MCLSCNLSSTINARDAHFLNVNNSINSSNSQCRPVTKFSDLFIDNSYRLCVNCNIDRQHQHKYYYNMPANNRYLIMNILNITVDHFND